MRHAYLAANFIIYATAWLFIFSWRRQTASSMTTKRQSTDYKEKEALAKATKRQFAAYREREAQGKATQCQSSEYGEIEAQAKKQCRVRQVDSQ